MNQYVTGSMIKKIREEKGMTQVELAMKLKVSDKAISKWETGRGYPDITLIKPLAEALGISTIELLSGENVTNTNKSFNMAKSKIYVCPICGNIIFAAGDAVISCCGLTLPALEAEVQSENCPYPLNIEPVEDEYYVSIDHPMQKDHFISFMAAVSDDRVEIVKLYPEGTPACRFKRRPVDNIYFYCNHHSLYKKKP